MTILPRASPPIPQKPDHEKLLLDKESLIDQLKLDISCAKKEYNKYPSEERKTLVTQLMEQLQKLKLERKNLKDQYVRDEKQKKKEIEETLERERKEKMFAVFQQIILQYHIVSIPEKMSREDHWINIRWWNIQTTRWVKDMGFLATVFQTVMENNQYIGDKADFEEFNAYIQRNSRIPYAQWNIYLLFKNGIFKDDIIIPNEFQFYTENEYPFNLLTVEQFNLRLDRFLLTYRFHQVTEDWEEICWWVGCCLRHLPMEYFLFFLGQPSGGKSPWARVIKNVVGNVGSDPFGKLGDKGGLSTSFDKYMNIDFDANMSFLTNDTVAQIKKIYGDDPMQPVRLLYANTFIAKISPYMLVLTNTMPKIVGGVNQDAIFKRAHICQFNNQLEDDKDFKNILDEPDFLDIFGSYCFYKSFETDLQNGDLCDRRSGRVKEFIDETQLLWMDSAYPVNKAVELILERSTDPDVEIFASQISIAVQAWFKDYSLNILHVAVPIYLMGEITEAITRLGGEKCVREKKKAYMGVDWTVEGKKIFDSTKNIQNLIDELPSEEMLERLTKGSHPPDNPFNN